MSIRRLTLFTVAVLLTACQALPSVPPAADPLKPRASTRPRASGEPPIAPASPPMALAMLKAPPGATSLLAGVVAIDAHYAVRAGGATLIGPDGATLVGADGASLIGPDGATLIGADGSTLIGMDGASVYVGAGLIGADGGSLIGADGASLVAAGAGNLIGKRKLTLMQASAGDRFNLGTVLPAAAMEIQVRSMIDDKPLALGVDGEGRPVFSVYTNAKGEYQVYLPGAISGRNVVVTAAAPLSQDARLSYDAMFDKGQASAAVGEDTALASAYLRQAFVSRLERLFVQNQDGSPVATADGLLPPGSEGDAGLARLRAAATKADLANMSRAERRARALATGDALLAYVDLPSQTFGGLPALEVLATELEGFRERVTAKMIANPTYFESQAFLTRANRRLATEDLGLPADQKRRPYRIERPSDVADFVLQDILMSPSRSRTSEELPEVLEACGYDPAAKAATLDAIGGVLDVLLFSAATVLLANPGLDDGRGGQIFALDAAVTAMETSQTGERTTP